jgi:PAS domain S-box-containing protein
MIHPSSNFLFIKQDFFHQPLMDAQQRAITNDPISDLDRDAYQKLQESEVAFRSLVENAQHFAVYRVAVDPQSPIGGRLVFVSPSIMEIVGGQTAEDFSHWFHNLHPADVQRVVEANRRSVELGVPYNETTRVFHPLKKQWVWLHTLSNPFYDAGGKLTHFDGMVIDITDQMQLREVERLRQAAEGLREIIAIINSNRSLQEILDFIARQANQLLQASSTMIRQVFYDQGMIRTVARINLPEDFDPVWVARLVPTASDQILMARQPVVVEDVQAEWGQDLQDLERVNLDSNGPAATVQHYKTLLKVPIFLRDEIYGAITFHYEQPRTFSAEDLSLGMTLGDQAALAIENARLIEQVKEQAVAEERSRLSRELHDAVTQTLFSTTLTAEVLPRIWERNPAEGRKKLEELRELTRGALAEMRTLLVELRPDALADAELIDLLRHLTNAFIARARVPAQFIVEVNHALPSGSGTLPLDVKIAFYRIAQEALNNILKYAEANQVTISLNCQGEVSARKVELSVVDDGLGFDPDPVLSADHFGLRIMKERAKQVGAAFDITSQPGAGTRIHILWLGPSSTVTMDEKE